MQKFSKLNKLFEAKQTTVALSQVKDGDSNSNFEEGVTEKVYNYRITGDTKTDTSLSATSASVLQKLGSAPAAAMINTYLESRNGEVPLGAITVYSSPTGTELTISGQVFIFTPNIIPNKAAVKKNTIKGQLFGLDMVMLNPQTVNNLSKALKDAILDPNVASASTGVAGSSNALVSQMGDKNTLAGRVFEKLSAAITRLSNFRKDQLNGSSEEVVFEFNKTPPGKQLTPIYYIMYRVLSTVSYNISEPKTSATPLDEAFTSAATEIFANCGDPAYANKQLGTSFGSQDAYDLLKAILAYCINAGDNSNWMLPHATNPQHQNYGVPGPDLMKLFNGAVMDVATLKLPDNPTSAAASGGQPAANGTNDGTSINTEDELVKVFSGIYKEVGSSAKTADEIKAAAKFIDVKAGLPFKKGDPSDKTGLATLQKLLFGAQKTNHSTGKYGDLTTAAVKQAFADSTL